MNDLSCFKDVIGNDKTLVIACPECFSDTLCSHPTVFLYTVFGCVLHLDNRTQQESIQHFVAHEGCSKIVIAGHSSCQALTKIQPALIPEMNIIHQCQQLIHQDFFFTRFSRHEVKLIGVLLKSAQEIKTIFCNGFPCNDMMSVN